MLDPLKLIKEQQPGRIKFRVLGSVTDESTLSYIGKSGVFSYLPLFIVCFIINLVRFGL